MPGAAATATSTTAPAATTKAQHDDVRVLQLQIKDVELANKSLQHEYDQLLQRFSQRDKAMSKLNALRDEKDRLASDLAERDAEVSRLQHELQQAGADNRRQLRLAQVACEKCCNMCSPQLCGT
jgi:predicted RNase H-like nuclease (RuvC/YqgF family)